MGANWLNPGKDYDNGEKSTFSMHVHEYHRKQKEVDCIKKIFDDHPGYYLRWVWVEEKEQEKGTILGTACRKSNLFLFKVKSSQNTVSPLPLCHGSKTKLFFLGWKLSAKISFVFLTQQLFPALLQALKKEKRASGGMYHDCFPCFFGGEGGTTPRCERVWQDAQE